MYDKLNERMDYEILDHPADIRIRVFGNTHTELFINSAVAMMDITTERELVGAKQEVQIQARGDTADELLVHWLEEILYVVETMKFLFRCFRVESMSENEITGYGIGEKIDFSLHELYYEIKAVTYHELKIRESEANFMVEILFDI
ncbi:MAG: archease [Candidatus Dadabacteria bacterium]|nr:archease [Candidatus Dadabacteria bacterium]